MARRQSMTPAPVSSRRDFTMSAVIATCVSETWPAVPRPPPAREPAAGGERPANLRSVAVGRVDATFQELFFCAFLFFHLLLAGFHAFEAGVGHLAAEQLDGADRVVVGRDGVVDLLGV